MTFAADLFKEPLRDSTHDAMCAVILRAWDYVSRTAHEGPRPPIAVVDLEHEVGALYVDVYIETAAPAAGTNRSRTAWIVDAKTDREMEKSCAGAVIRQLKNYRRMAQDEQRKSGSVVGGISEFRLCVVHEGQPNEVSMFLYQVAKVHVFTLAELQAEAAVLG